MSWLCGWFLYKHVFLHIRHFNIWIKHEKYLSRYAIQQSRNYASLNLFKPSFSGKKWSLSGQHRLSGTILHAILYTKWGLSSRAVTWIPKKIFRISYQNLYSRFFSTILVWFLFSVHKFLLILKFIFYLEFQSVLCAYEISRNMQRKEKKKKETMK